MRDLTSESLSLSRIYPKKGDDHHHWVSVSADSRVILRSGRAPSRSFIFCAPAGRLCSEPLLAGRPCAAACPAQRLTLTGPDAQNGQNPWFFRCTFACNTGLTHTPNLLLQVHLEVKLLEKATLDFHTCGKPLLCWKLWGNSDSP